MKQSPGYPSSPGNPRLDRTCTLQHVDLQAEVAVAVADTGQQVHELREIEFGQASCARHRSAGPRPELSEQVALTRLQAAIPLERLHRITALVAKARRRAGPN